MKRYLAALAVVIVVGVVASTRQDAVPVSSDDAALRVEGGEALVQSEARAEDFAGQRPFAAISERRSEAGPDLVAAAPAPLPPLDAPVADILDELQARADAGDVAAACRLSAEVSLCASVSNFDAPALEERLAQREELGEQAYMRLAERFERDARRHERCLGVQPGVLLQQPRLDFQAARLGDMDAAFRFLRGRSMHAGALLHDPSLAALYRQHAWPLFVQLFEAGHPSAVMLWADAAGDGSHRTPLAAVMPEEWRRSDLARGLVLEILGGQTIVHDRFPRPPPDVEAEAAQLFQSHFAASPHYHGGPPRSPPVVGQPEDCEALVTSGL